jgi:uncharacterized membrane protein
MFLITRGLWLAMFDLIGFGFIISFCFPPALTIGPLWVSGLSMIALSAFLSLPARAVGVIGLVILFLHNLLDSIPASRFGRAAILWDFLHQQAFVSIHGLVLAIIYPLLPWIGVLFVGYAFGAVLLQPAQKRMRIVAASAITALALFGGLRAFSSYGNGNAYVKGLGPAHSAMSFLDLNKYPPSLDYILATGGVLLILFNCLDWLAQRNILPRFRAWLDIYGRVPFFFYAGHLVLLHLAVLGLTATEHLNWHQWCQPLALLTHKIPGWGFSLPGVYIAWLGVLILMYMPCLWFGRLKARRRDWWLRYL